MSNFIVEMRIKEHRGQFTPKIDYFKGTPEEAREILDFKYCNKEDFIKRVKKALNAAAKEFDKILENDKKNNLNDE